MFAADVTGQLSVRVDELGFNNVSNKQWLHIHWIAFASKDAAVKMYLLLLEMAGFILISQKNICLLYLLSPRFSKNKRGCFDTRRPSGRTSVCNVTLSLLNHLS